MSFLRTIPEEEAEGAVAELYERLRQSLGNLPNYAREFSLRPELFAVWRKLAGIISSNMDPRRYELATVASAVTRRSTYCSLAHGEKLLDLGSAPDEVIALAQTPQSAGLDEVEQAIVDYAAKVAGDPVSVTQADIDRLRELGLTDAEIFDVAAAAAARLFFTALGDATGTLADGSYREAIPELVEVLSVGRLPEE